jgi:hypothetical protein
MYLHLVCSTAAKQHTCLGCLMLNCLACRLCCPAACRLFSDEQREEMWTAYIADKELLVEMLGVSC